MRNTLALVVLTYIYYVVLIHASDCLDNDGNAVDWFIALKTDSKTGDS